MTPRAAPGKHGLAAGAMAPSADWTIDQGWEHYTPAQHAVWQTLFARLTQLLPHRACDAYIAGMRDLPIAGDEIPDFRRLSDVLMRRTGWRVVAVPGLVPDEVFFKHLANRRFPAGNFIRRADQLGYIEEPDVFHDVFGHVPMLMNPEMADYLQAYGKGGLRAQQLGVLPNLARVYWYTVEFGLVMQPQGLRIYGAGIVSSLTESAFALDNPAPNRIWFDLQRVMRTRYRIDGLQQTYFVVHSLDELLRLARIDFAPLYEAVRGLNEFTPGDVLPEDRLIALSSGRD
jgi:phenylalanine-4-hydroxylase